MTAGIYWSRRLNGATSDVQFSDELMSNGTFLADKHPMTSCVVVALLEAARNRRQREVVFLGQRIVRRDVGILNPQRMCISKVGKLPTENHQNSADGDFNISSDVIARFPIF